VPHGEASRRTGCRKSALAAARKAAAPEITDGRASGEAETSRLGWKDYDLARRELNVFTARATDALNDEQFDRAMRYALQVCSARGRSTELEGKLAAGRSPRGCTAS